uniref:Uncharacterized protein n=1 Tax=Arundo donax TaxID=35708 RepID=A0A0A9HR87_ARUDO
MLWPMCMTFELDNVYDI